MRNTVTPLARPLKWHRRHCVPRVATVAGYQARLQALREVMGELDRQVARLDRQIAARLAGYPAIRHIGGIGPVSAAVFVAEIGNITRFPAGPHRERPGRRAAAYRASASAVFLGSAPGFWPLARLPVLLGPERIEPGRAAVNPLAGIRQWRATRRRDKKMDQFAETMIGPLRETLAAGGHGYSTA